MRRARRMASAGVLSLALLAVPAVAGAQTTPTPVAIVEASPTDIAAWGYAATVAVGDSVTWANLGSQTHTVTAADGSFDSGLVAPGASASLAFDTPGTYPYLCVIHPTMKGFVVVSADAASSTPMAIVEGTPTDLTTWAFAVTIPAGQTVAWTNSGSLPHTATAVDGLFDTGLLAPGAREQLGFDTPGIYSYACTPHPWMKGSVAVN